MTWTSERRAAFLKMAKERGFGKWMKGKTLSSEHRENIGKAFKGKPFTGKPSDWRGKKHSEESKAKMSAAAKGRTLGLETRQKISAALKGKKSHRWRGGLTGEAHTIRHSLEYRTWRRHVLQRDDYVCQACGKRGGKLQADHVLPFSLYPDLRFEILNGRTLCVPCHRKTDTYGGSKRAEILIPGITA